MSNMGMVSPNDSNAEFWPTVSIMIPTNGRPEFLPRALAGIHAQDFPMENIKEVIIVDDSPVDLRSPVLHPGLQSYAHENTTGISLPVSYIALDSQASVGSKRNMAAQQSTGDVIVHWDDDDIYGAQRLKVQLRPIVDGTADMVILPHTYTYFMHDDNLFEASTPTASWGPHFGTLVYDRKLYDEASSKYPDNSQAEDYGFAQTAVLEKGARIMVLPAHPEPHGVADEDEASYDVGAMPVALTATPVFVCVRHGSNTWSWSTKTEQVKFHRSAHQVGSNLTPRRPPSPAYPSAHSPTYPPTHLPAYPPTHLTT